MQIYTKLSCEAYLETLKDRLGSFTDFGSERFTGFVIGRIFSVTHHAGHEFNRRITNERNSAVGFVRKTAEGTQIRCVRLKGWTTPQALLLLFLMCFVFVLVAGWGTLELGFAVMLSLGMTVFMALFTAVCDCLTERGEQGALEMYALMVDPSDPLAYLDLC